MEIAYIIIALIIVFTLGFVTGTIVEANIGKIIHKLNGDTEMNKKN